MKMHVRQIMVGEHWVAKTMTGSVGSSRLVVVNGTRYVTITIRQYIALKTF